jgi:hypothetical protein
MAGFSLASAVNGAAEWACRAPLLRSVVGNPVFTALLITALVAVVVIAFCRGAVKTSTRGRARALLYTFLMVTAVMFFHHHATLSRAREDTAQSGVRDVFSSIQQSRELGTLGAVPVLPQSYGALPVLPQSYGALPPAPWTRGGTPPGVQGGGLDALGAEPGAPNPPGAPPALEIEDVVLPATAPHGAR